MKHIFVDREQFAPEGEYTCLSLSLSAQLCDTPVPKAATHWPPAGRTATRTAVKQEQHRRVGALMEAHGRYTLHQKRTLRGQAILMYTDVHGFPTNP